MKGFFKSKPPTPSPPQYTKPIKFAQGNFGVIYRAIEVSNNSEIAIKIERTQKKSDHTLKHEALILKSLKNTLGVPELLYFSQESTYSILIMPLYGQDTKELFTKKANFSNDDALFIVSQVLAILERVHAKKIIHRDLKPANIVLSQDGKSLVLIDFGLASFYCNEAGVHIKQKPTEQYIGNMRFGSTRGHFFQEMSRKDDLESLGYMILYFLKGSLPWDHLDMKDQRKKIMEIGRMKATLDVASLCKNEEYPDEISEYFNIVRNLKFDEEPNYKLLRETLANAEIKMKKKELELSNKNKLQMVCSSPEKDCRTLDAAIFKEKMMFFSQTKVEKENFRDYNCNPDEENSLIFLSEKYDDIYQKGIGFMNPFAKKQSMCFKKT